MGILLFMKSFHIRRLIHIVYTCVHSPFLTMISLLLWCQPAGRVPERIPTWARPARVRSRQLLLSRSQGAISTSTWANCDQGTLREFLSSPWGNFGFSCGNFLRICWRTAERLRRNHRIYERSPNGLKRGSLSEDFNYESPRQVKIYYSFIFFECVFIVIYLYI